ncbi:hypothetical protein SRHO_G00325230 [Serrasalmus rhombeus]
MAQPVVEGELKDEPEQPEDTNTPPASHPVSTQEVQPPKSKKPRVLELPSSPSQLAPGFSLDKVNAAVNSLLAPGSATNTLTPTVITSHALVSDLRLPRSNLIWKRFTFASTHLEIKGKVLLKMTSSGVK